MRRSLVGAPALALLGAQIGLFVWMAGHGLDFTDESYYLLNYQHWRTLTATSTFFGAYFEWPFRALGGDVGAMRIFGLVLLVAAGGFFTWRVFVFRRDAAEPVPWRYVIAGMAGSLYYYSFVTTLRAPSYNLLVLFCILVATGLLLVLTEGRSSRERLLWVSFGYGLLVGACALTKATSALAMVVCHLVFLLTFGPVKRVPEWVAVAAAGVAANLLALHLAQPRWFDVLREGVLLTTTLDARYTTIPFGALWDAVLRGATRLLPALAIGALAFVIVVRRCGRPHRWVMSLLVVLLVGGIFWTIQVQGYGKSWWALIAFGTALLWMAERLCRETPVPRWCDVRGVAALTVLLFMMPICYSIGTNGSLPAHTQMAAVFAIVAMMLPLRRLHALGLLHERALSVALALMCVPMLVSQWRSLGDPAFAYRLRNGLMDQQQPLALGSNGRVLKIDAITREGVVKLTQSLVDAGYRTGEPIIDATGDGPGLVYALGGRPLGVAWMIAGYPGSERVAARVLDTLPPAELRRAWVLTAEDNPRALRGFPELLIQRTGGRGHELVGKVNIVPQYRWDGLPALPVSVSLWRPCVPG